jgi:phage shock protein A
VAWLVPALALACQWPGSADESIAATVTVTGMEPGTTLADALALLHAQLDTAAAGLDEAGTRSLARVEAISDRLLETRLPFAWSSAESYSLEARLRQIQSQADRVESLRSGGAGRDVVMASLLALRGEVERLEATLEMGGTAPPTPIGTLLDSLDRMRR